MTLYLAKHPNFMTVNDDRIGNNGNVKCVFHTEGGKSDRTAESTCGTSSLAFS